MQRAKQKKGGTRSVLVTLNPLAGVSLYPRVVSLSSDRLSIVTELPKLFLYDIIVSLSNDTTETSATISNSSYP